MSEEKLMKQKLLNKLVALANSFDKNGMKREADILDSLIRHTAGEIQWGPAEWLDSSEQGGSAFYKGYELSVNPPSEENKKFFWRVDATSQVSEYPEVFATGSAKTLEEAKKAAEAAAMRAVKDDKKSR